MFIHNLALFEPLAPPPYSPFLYICW